MPCRDMNPGPRRNATLTLLDPSPTEGSSDVPMLPRHGSEAAIAEDQDWTVHESDDDEDLALRGFAALPRCALVEDETLVARASVAIRALLEQTVTRGMQEVGDYLLREFYDDAPATVGDGSHIPRRNGPTIAPAATPDRRMSSDVGTHVSGRRPARGSGARTGCEPKHAGTPAPIHGGNRGWHHCPTVGQPVAHFGSTAVRRLEAPRRILGVSRDLALE